MKSEIERAFDAQPRLHDMGVKHEAGGEVIIMSSPSVVCDGDLNVVRDVSGNRRLRREQHSHAIILNVEGWSRHRRNSWFSSPEAQSSQPQRRQR